MPVNIGLIGYGRMGKILADNFHRMPASAITAVSDICPLAQESLAGKPYASAQFFTDYRLLLARPDIDAVVIATLPEQHFAIAAAALESDRHVFVEKPMTMNREEAHTLQKMAAARDLRLGVDHVLVHEEAATRLAEWLQRGTYGEMAVFEHVRRHSLADHLQSRNCFVELAPHPLSLLDEFDQHQSSDAEISAVGDGMRYFDTQIKLSSGVAATIHVSLEEGLPRAEEQRGTVITCKPKRINQDEQVAHVITWDEMRLPAKPTQTVQVLREGKALKAEEYGAVLPLHGVITDFVSAMRERRMPKAHGEHGIRVAQMMHAMQQSMAMNGKEVKVALAEISRSTQLHSRV